MSPSAVRRLRRHERHICLQCRSHRARYQYRGYVRADRDHTLCFQCFRAQCERTRAKLLLEVAWPAVRRASSAIYEAGLD